MSPVLPSVCWKDSTDSEGGQLQALRGEGNSSSSSHQEVVDHSHSARLDAGTGRIGAREVPDASGKPAKRPLETTANARGGEHDGIILQQRSYNCSSCSLPPCSLALTCRLGDAVGPLAVAAWAITCTVGACSGGPKIEYDELPLPIRVSELAVVLGPVMMVSIIGALGIIISWLVCRCSVVR